MTVEPCARVGSIGTWRRRDTTEDPLELDLRRRAEKRLEDRSDLGAHVLAYVLVNGFLVVIWAMTGGPSGFFWPAFPMLGWGIGLQREQVVRGRGVERLHEDRLAGRAPREPRPGGHALVGRRDRDDVGQPFGVQARQEEVGGARHGRA